MDQATRVVAVLAAFAFSISLFFVTEPTIDALVIYDSEGVKVDPEPKLLVWSQAQKDVRDNPVPEGCTYYEVGQVCYDTNGDGMDDSIIAVLESASCPDHFQLVKACAEKCCG